MISDKNGNVIEIFKTNIFFINLYEYIIIKDVKDENRIVLNTDGMGVYPVPQGYGKRNIE